VTKGKPENLLKLREAFPTLPTSKIIKMNNVRLGVKHGKPKMQIITKGPSRKNILISMNTTDKGKILNNTNTHTNQINGLLKSYKSSININCIRELWNSITITTNVVAASSDLTFIEKYFKGLDNLKSKDILPCLPQSKSFLKILGVPYFGDNSSAFISIAQVEDTLSKTFMFKGITLSSRP